ncbi:MAG: CopG family antitoxin [Desulfobacterales bacterium]
MKKDKIIPNFKNEDEEREFWATHSPLDYFDSKTFKKASFPRLKPSVKSISIRWSSLLLTFVKDGQESNGDPFSYGLLEPGPIVMVTTAREGCSKTS